MRIKIRVKAGMRVGGVCGTLTIDDANWVEWEPAKNAKILVTTADGTCFEIEAAAVKSVAFCPLNGAPAPRWPPIKFAPRPAAAG